jgi:hypothetical protein
VPVRPHAKIASASTNDCLNQVNSLFRTLQPTVGPNDFIWIYYVLSGIKQSYPKMYKSYTYHLNLTSANTAWESIHASLVHQSQVETVERTGG